MRVFAVPLRPVGLGTILVLGGCLIVLGTAAGLALESVAPVVAVAALLALGALAYHAVWAAPATFVSIGIALSVFSGHSDELGLPIGPDRLFIAAGLASLVLQLPGAVRRRTIVWRPVHVVLAVVVALTAVSGLAAGTLLTQSGIFALLDRLGLVPFLIFVVSPLVFATARERNILLVTLVALGGYLSLTTFFEATGLHQFVFPRYISDPGVGIHFGRARGPFAEAAGNGLGLFGCAVGAAAASATWTTRRSRGVAVVVTVACLVATMFTLTRAIWLATILAAGLALLANARTRTLLGPLVIFGGIALLVALTFVPQFSEQAERRAGSERPLWDRYNTNRAAVSMVREEPLVGIGWERFKLESEDHLWLAGDYPLTGKNLDVHNVFLSHAAELGVPLMLLWTVGLLLAVGGGIIRSGPIELDVWRLGTLALFVHWLVVASFGPLSQAFPNLLLWTWAGIAGMAYTSRPSAPVDVADVADRDVVPAR